VAILLADFFNLPVAVLHADYHQGSIYQSAISYCRPQTGLPAKGPFDYFLPDATLLKTALTSYADSQDSSIAEQVFGQQAREQGISLKHQANLLYERALLHRRHLKDIDRRLMQCHEQLSIIKMHNPIDGGRGQQNLERLVLQLEQEHRKEELEFWKDSKDIRQDLFENAHTYTAAKRRERVFYDVEAQNG